MVTIPVLRHRDFSCSGAGISHLERGGIRHLQRSGDYTFTKEVAILDIYKGGMGYYKFPKVVFVGVDI